MRILVAGASGFIGTAVVASLRANGDEVRTLVRRPSRAADEYQWHPPAGTIAPGAFDGVGAVLNLCGAPLFPARWSAARKQVLLDSRLEPTEVLAEAVATHQIPVLVNASAVGYYGNAGEASCSETAPAGDGFLAGLCRAWERATVPARAAGARVITLRNGVVLSGDGGLLHVLKHLFRVGLGGRLGTGKQFLSWISITDEIAAIRFALTSAALTGPVNAVAPHPVRNAEFTAALGRAVHRPAPWWAPDAVLRTVLGQAAEEMVLFGQRAVPNALTEAGFQFDHPTVDEALRVVL